MNPKTEIEPQITGKPFFINAWIHETHLPHVPTKESMEKRKHLYKQKQVYAAVISDGEVPEWISK